MIHPDTLLGRWKRLAAVSRQLGHASAAFTADIYAHHSDEAAAHAAELLAEVLAGGGITGE